MHRTNGRKSRRGPLLFAAAIAASFPACLSNLVPFGGGSAGGSSGATSLDQGGGHAVAGMNSALFDNGNSGLTTIAALVRATYPGCPNTAVKMDLYVLENGAPYIHNRCYLDSAADPVHSGQSWCLFQHPLPATMASRQVFVRLWQVQNDCQTYADEAGAVTAYDDYPINSMPNQNGQILPNLTDDSGYTQQRQARMVTIDKGSYLAKVDPHGGATFEFYSKRSRSGLPAGEYANAIHANSGAAWQMDYAYGAPRSLTTTPCGGQGYYNPTQAGAACGYDNGVPTAAANSPDPADPSSGLLVFCDGALNNLCTQASATLGIGLHRMMNWDYGPGYGGPYNATDQTYFTQTVSSKEDNFIEYSVAIRQDGAPQSVAIETPTLYMTNQFSVYDYPTQAYPASAPASVVIPVNRTGLDANNYNALAATQGTTDVAWLTLENRADGLNLVANDYVTVAWFYAPDFAAATDSGWVGQGVSISQTTLYHAIKLSNARALNMATGKTYHAKYVVFPYRYDETIASRFGTLTVEQTIQSLAREYAQSFVGSGTPKIAFTSAQASDPLPGWPAASAIDGSTATVYSSEGFTGPQNTRSSFLAAWLPGARTVSKLVLQARTVNGIPRAFPTSYNVYVTDPANASWTLSGLHLEQPDPSGKVIIDLTNGGAPISTWGVMIVPVGLGKDDNGNYYFQIAEMSCR